MVSFYSRILSHEQSPPHRHLGIYTSLSDGGREASNDEVTSSYSFRHWDVLKNETAVNVDFHKEISIDCSLNNLV